MMPKYLYRCNNCEIKVAFFHSMTENKEDCDSCMSSNTLERIPSKFNTVSDVTEKQVGDVVRHSIREIKEELQQEKEKLSNEFYS